jgi:hypothetical protein
LVLTSAYKCPGTRICKREAAAVAAAKAAAAAAAAALAAATAAALTYMKPGLVSWQLQQQQQQHRSPQ